MVLACVILRHSSVNMQKCRTGGFCASHPVIAFPLNPLSLYTISTRFELLNEKRSVSEFRSIYAKANKRFYDYRPSTTLLLHSFGLAECWTLFRLLNVIFSEQMILSEACRPVLFHSSNNSSSLRSNSSSSVQIPPPATPMPFHCLFVFFCVRF